MEELIRALPDTFIPLFVAIDIFALLPVFIALTAGMPAKKRKRTARLSIITALFVSLIFTAIGEGIFRVLGITVNDFKVAGGLVLLILAVLELTKPLHNERPAPSSETAGIVPIGVPLIVGPAVLTTILVLVDHYGVLPTVIALILNLIVVCIALMAARRVVKFLGKSGIAALSKIMAILLAAIAVMMIRLGIEGFLGSQTPFP